MKHLSKQEAIGRMMLAQANLITENYQCELNWYPSMEQCVLNIYAKKAGEEPHLPILTHPDYKSVKRDLNENCYCISYTWDSETEPV